MQSYLPLLLCFLFLTGCDDDDNGDQFILDASLINFMNPVVGQTNIYHGFTANCADSGEPQRDTISLSVTAVTDELLEISERSNAFNNIRVSNTVRFNRIPSGLVYPQDSLALSVFFLRFRGDTIKFNETPSFIVEFGRCFYRSDGNPFDEGILASVDEVGYNRTWVNLNTMMGKLENSTAIQYIFLDEHTVPFSVIAYPGFEEDRLLSYYELQLP